MIWCIVDLAWQDISRAQAGADLLTKINYVVAPLRLPGGDALHLWQSELLSAGDAEASKRHLDLLNPFLERNHGSAEKVAFCMAARSRPLILSVPMGRSPGLPDELLHQLAPPVQPCQIVLQGDQHGHHD